MINCIHELWMGGSVTFTLISIKPHTHKAIHDHTDCSFDRSAIGMIHWNVHV